MSVGPEHTSSTPPPPSVPTDLLPYDPGRMFFRVKCLSFVRTPHNWDDLNPFQVPLDLKWVPVTCGPLPPTQSGRRSSGRTPGQVLLDTGSTVVRFPDARLTPDSIPVTNLKHGRRLTPGRPVRSPPVPSGTTDVVGVHEVYPVSDQPPPLFLSTRGIRGGVMTPGEGRQVLEGVGECRQSEE